MHPLYLYFIAALGGVFSVLLSSGRGREKWCLLTLGYRAALHSSQRNTAEGPAALVESAAPKQGGLGVAPGKKRFPQHQLGIQTGTLLVALLQEWRVQMIRLLHFPSARIQVLPNRKTSEAKGTFWRLQRLKQSHATLP